MKKTSNVISIFLFIILLPFIFIANLITDIWEATKVNTDLPEQENPHETNTTYPEYPMKDFNKWSEYIYKLRN